jgi:hypothetical protein
MPKLEDSMTTIEKQIQSLLERKQEITQFTDNQRWLIEAVELLLRHQLELRAELRNAGILR